MNFEMPGTVGIRGSPFRPVAWTIWWGWNVPASHEYVLLIQNISSEGNYLWRSSHSCFVLTQQSILSSPHPILTPQPAYYSKHPSQAPSHNIPGNRPFYLSASKSTRYQRNARVELSKTGKRGSTWVADVNTGSEPQRIKRANSQANSADTSNTASHSSNTDHAAPNHDTSSSSNPPSSPPYPPPASSPPTSSTSQPSSTRCVQRLQSTLSAPRHLLQGTLAAALAIRTSSSLGVRNWALRIRGGKSPFGRVWK